MRIAGMMKSSLIDFPDRIACVLFTQGCNWNCWYCHNQELIPQVSSAESQEGIPPAICEKTIFSFLDTRRKLLDGVVISGGEPTLHADLPDFMARIAALGYRVKLDTNGSNPQMIQHILDRHLAAYIALDIKGPWDQYHTICRAPVNVQAVQQTLSLLKGSSIGWEARTTVFSGLTEAAVSACRGYCGKKDQ